MVTIRPEHPDDLDAVAALHVRAWQAGYAGILPAAVLDALSAPAWAERRRERRAGGTVHTLVATDGPVAGFVTLGPYREKPEPGVGEIYAIYLEPERVGTGVGRALMTAALDELRARGFRTVRLWVLEANHRARRFYERAGFAPDGSRAVYEGALPGGGDRLALDAIRYARALG